LHSANDVATEWLSKQVSKNLIHMTFAHVYNKIQNEDNTIKHKIRHN